MSRTPGVYGPYARGSKWRLIVQRADGTRDIVSYSSRGAAEREAEKIRTGLGGRTARAAVEAFLTDMEGRSKRASVDVSRRQLAAFLALSEADQPLPMAPHTARRLSDDRAAKVAAATHHNELRLARQWYAWVLSAGWITGENPFKALKPKPGKRRGKPQLRIDEARKFLAVALAEDSIPGNAAALALLTGARASEITCRTVRDLDADGTMLCIPDDEGEAHWEGAKTRNGCRYLAVPEVLQPRLRALAAGKAPNEPLWGRTFTRFRLHDHVKRLCVEAGVPVVCPHGLRGAFATIAVKYTRMAVDQVAGALGQDRSGDVTRRHYLRDGTEGEAQGKLVAGILFPAPASNDVIDADCTEKPADWLSIPMPELCGF